MIGIKIFVVYSSNENQYEYLVHLEQVLVRESKSLVHISLISVLDLVGGFPQLDMKLPLFLQLHGT